MLLEVLQINAMFLKKPLKNLFYVFKDTPQLLPWSVVGKIYSKLFPSGDFPVIFFTLVSVQMLPKVQRKLCVI